MLHFSDFFGVPPSALDDYGAFNISLINDLPVFIDPFLLFDSPRHDYREQHEKMIEYIRFLQRMSLGTQLTDKQLKYWFTFPEVRENWMGYCPEGNAGHGLGMGFARHLHRNLGTIFKSFGDAKVTRGSHIEQLALIEDRVGRDCISDFTMNLVKPFLLDYTRTFARLHLKPNQRRAVTVKKVDFDYATGTWKQAKYELPVIRHRHVILAPKEILTRHERWINREDMIDDFDDLVPALPDPQLRDRVNAHLLSVLSENPQKKETEAARRGVYLRFPELIDYYIRYKEDRGALARRRSASVVSEVETLFRVQASQLRDLLEAHGFYAIRSQTIAGTRKRAAILRRVVEEHGGDRLLLLNGQPLRRLDDLNLLRRLLWLADAKTSAEDVRIGHLIEFRFVARTSAARLVDGIGPDGPVAALFAFTKEELERAEEAVRKAPASARPNLIVIDARL